MTDVLYRFYYLDSLFAVHAFALKRLPLLDTWCRNWADRTSEHHMDGIPVFDFDGVYMDVLPTSKHLDAFVHWAYSSNVQRLAEVMEWKDACRAADLMCSSAWEEHKTEDISNHLRRRDLKWQLGRLDWVEVGRVILSFFFLALLWLLALDRYYAHIAQSHKNWNDPLLPGVSTAIALLRSVLLVPLDLLLALLDSSLNVLTGPFLP